MLQNTFTQGLFCLLRHVIIIIFFFSNWWALGVCCNARQAHVPTAACPGMLVVKGIAEASLLESSYLSWSLPSFLLAVFSWTVKYRSRSPCEFPVGDEMLSGELGASRHAENDYLGTPDGFNVCYWILCLCSPIPCKFWCTTGAIRPLRIALDRGSAWRHLVTVAVTLWPPAPPLPLHILKGS